MATSCLQSFCRWFQRMMLLSERVHVLAKYLMSHWRHFMKLEKKLYCFLKKLFRMLNAFIQFWASLLVSGLVQGLRSPLSYWPSPPHPLEVGAAAAWLWSSPTNTTPPCGGSSPAAGPLWQGEAAQVQFVHIKNNFKENFIFIIRRTKVIVQPCAFILPVFSFADSAATLFRYKA